MTIAERIDPATAERLMALRAALEASAIEQIRAAAVTTPGVPAALFIEPRSALLAASLTP